MKSREVSFTLKSRPLFYAALFLDVVHSRPPTSYRAAGRLPWERRGRGGEVDKPGGLPVERGVIVIHK